MSQQIYYLLDVTVKLKPFLDTGILGLDDTAKPVNTVYFENMLLCGRFKHSSDVDQ